MSKQFGRIHQALGRNGFFLLDVAGPGRAPREGPARAFVEQPDWVVLVIAEEDRRSRILTRRITSFRRVGELFRRDHEVHELRLIPRSEVTEELRGIGFRVQNLGGYGTLPFPMGLAGFLARKP